MTTIKDLKNVTGEKQLTFNQINPATPEVKKLIIRDDGIFSCVVNGRSYVGRYETFTGVVAVSFCKEINATKQTTLRIKSNIEMKIGRLLNK